MFRQPFRRRSIKSFKIDELRGEAHLQPPGSTQYTIMIHWDTHPNNTNFKP